jgi:hypothetical protein
MSKEAFYLDTTTNLIHYLVPDTPPPGYGGWACGGTTVSWEDKLKNYQFPFSSCDCPDGSGCPTSALQKMSFLQELLYATLTYAGVSYNVTRIRECPNSPCKCGGYYLLVDRGSWSMNVVQLCNSKTCPTSSLVAWSSGPVAPQPVQQPAMPIATPAPVPIQITQQLQQSPNQVAMQLQKAMQFFVNYGGSWKQGNQPSPPTTPIAAVNTKEYPHTCPKCKGPGIQLFTSFDCLNKCR